jgi:hypothetical protein
MRLPPTAPPSTDFYNAPGSTVPKEYAIAARHNPDNIAHMAETPFEEKQLKTEALVRQYVIIVDRSGSMGAQDGNGTRWTSAEAAVARMVETVFKYDTDHSVPLYLFDNHVEFVGELTSAAQVMNVFKSYQPRGTTDLAKVLKEALGTWAGNKRPNYSIIPGTTFLVLLDGSADDEEAVISTLKYYANPSNGFVENHTQIAVSFIQIGNDARATKFLETLDNTIQPDICDTKKASILCQSRGIDQVLFDAIFD